MQHYTRNTVESREWCSRCQKNTMHRIDGVKRGPCLECIGQLDAKHEAFEERAAIMEFDGGMSRLEAEFKAAEDVGLAKQYQAPSQQQLGFKR